MSIINLIKEDIKNAMKQNDSFSRDILRFVLSKANSIAKEDKNRELEEKDILVAIQRQIKQNKEVIEIYKKEHKDFSKEEKEISILIEYLPKQKTEEEMKTIILNIIDSVEKSPKSKGLVMKELAKYKDEMDMKRAGEIVNEMLVSN